MNRDTRRRLVQLHSLKDGGPEDACRLCAFIRVQLVGDRDRLYRDREGRSIDLPIAERLHPPQGLSWANAVQNAPDCTWCVRGVVTTKHAQGENRETCGHCSGTGKRFKGDEWAPLCQFCAQAVHAWLEIRAQAHVRKHAPAGGKIVVATEAMVQQALAGVQQLNRQVPGLGRILIG